MSVPPTDLAETIRISVQKNREIPAILDAYGEFVDSQIGPLELACMDEIFARILDNLMQRFPEIASKRAANTSKNDVLSFLSLANNDPERVKHYLRSELRSVNQTMAISIAERFSRMGNDERRAIDATLRLIRRSNTEILFRAEIGKLLSTAGKEYEKFFVSVRTEAPAIRELRYENLVVEKGVFNKLLLKTNDKDYFIWVPSLYAKENVDYLIERTAVPNEHFLLLKLREIKGQDGGTPSQIRSFLESVLDELGVVSESVLPPSELRDFLVEQGNYLVMSPLDLDDAASFLREAEEARRAAQKEQEERRKQQEEEVERAEEVKRAELLNQRRKQVFQPVLKTQPTEAKPMASSSSEKQEGLIYLGKQLDKDQLVSLILRRISEKDLVPQVKTIGDFYLDSNSIKSKGMTIVGSSGSGRSTTLRRVLDGLGSELEAAKDGSRLVIIDQKGEHRGLAWKYHWPVYAFVQDSQAKEFRVPILSIRDETDAGESAGLIGDMLQEWCLQSGLNCSDQQAERISSTVRRQLRSGETKTPTLESMVDELAKEPDLVQLAQKLSKNFVAKASITKVFSEEDQMKMSDSSCLFDISGRGLRDPTTKEERQLISILILRHILRRGSSHSVIILEDILDRFKSQNLKRRIIGMVSKLLEAGNVFIVTSRSQTREFVGPNTIEVLHRLSGEKAIAEEIAGFNSDIPQKSLVAMVSLLPRGFAITSRIRGDQSSSSAIRIDPVQFG